MDYWWCRSPESSYLIEIELEFLKPLLSRLSGDYLICFDKIIKSAFFYRENRFKNFYFLIDDNSINFGPSVRGHSHQLPFLSDSIDSFIMPHILDFSYDNRLIIKEIWRCLVPEGHVVITGFNSYSLFGLPDFLKEEHQAKNLMAATRLERLLKTQGFYIEHFKTFYFRPRSLYGKDTFMTRFLEVLGQLFWPTMGCIYIFLAKKPVIGMTPINETAKAKKVVIPKAAVKPTIN